METADSLNDEFAGKVVLEIKGSDGKPRRVEKFCLDTGATESVANLNNLSAEGLEEVPFTSRRFVKLVDATT